MNTFNYPALLAALLMLGACPTADNSATDKGSDGPATGTTGTTADTQATDASTAEPSTSPNTATTDEPTTADPTTGATTEAATTDAATTEAATTGDDALSCDAYCATISAHCTGENTQYGALQTCMATCAAFAPGSLTDTSGGTLGCRIYHAGAAADMPDVHCTHAGPGGAGVCGANCDGFCTIAAQACPDAFPDADACQAACAVFPSEEPYDATDVAGDTFACRLYHLTAAAHDPAVHCSHIVADSPPCSD